MYITEEATNKILNKYDESTFCYTLKIERAMDERMSNATMGWDTNLPC